jgi:prepilin peptidase CpaA
MWSTTLWHDGIPALQWSVVLVAALIAFITDLRSRRIPNLLTFPLFLGGLAVSAWTAGGAGLADAAVAAVVLAFPYFLLFALAGGGAGDVKLMAGIGAWLGMVNGLVVLLAVALAGVIMGIAYAVHRRRAREVWTNLVGMGLSTLLVGLRAMTPPDRQGSGTTGEHMLKMPYGVPIFLGVCLSGVGMLVWRT